MGKPRIVIPITVQFSVRYAFRTGLLERMTEYAQPVVLLRWDDPVLIAELEQAGVETHSLPEAEYRIGYTRIKRQLDMWHLERLQSPSTAIDSRRLGQISPPTLRSRFRDTFYRINLALPDKPAQLLRKIPQALAQHTNIEDFESLLKRLKADAVFSLTPYFQREQLLLCAAKQQYLPLCTSIISFDNITTRGWIPVVFDGYFLWNRYNEVELRRAYPEAGASKIEIVGAPQFDFYWDTSYVWEETLWRKKLGLPQYRPVILFGAGHYSIVPHEPHWLQQLDEAVESGEIPERPIILFRRHPNDPLDRWLPVLKLAKHVVHDDPWKLNGKDIALTNIRREDIERLASTLAHCPVHINASSTMTIDGAIFDRPQVGPAYDDRPGRPYDRLTKELYLREHYLPITNSGGLDIATSSEELVAATCAGFERPARLADARKRMVGDICTYDDGRSTERLNTALKLFLVERDILSKAETKIAE